MVFDRQESVFEAFTQSDGSTTRLLIRGFAKRKIRNVVRATRLPHPGFSQGWYTAASHLFASRRPVLVSSLALSQESRLCVPLAPHITNHSSDHEQRQDAVSDHVKYERSVRPT